MKTKILKILFALSVATFLTLPGWLERLIVVGAPTAESFLNNFHHLSHVTRYDEAFGLLLMAAITILIYILDCVCSRHFPKIRMFSVHLFGVLVIFYVLNWVRNRILYRSFGNEVIYSDFGTSVLYPGLFVVTLLIAVLLAIKLPSFFRLAAKAFVVCMIPISIIIIFNESVGFVRIFPYLGKSYPLAPLQTIKNKPSANKSRVVWVLLDNYDYKLAFSEESSNDPLFEIPVVRSLKEKSVFGTDAQSPSIDTYGSMMSYFMGRYIYPAKLHLPDNLGIRDSKFPKKLGTAVELETLFDRLHKDGFNAALASQAFINHPYCRMFFRALSRCWQEGPHRAAPPSFIERVHFFAIEFIRNIPGFEGIAPKNLNFLFQKSWIKNLEALQKEALELVVDPAYQFVFLHYTMPHAPFIRDYKTNQEIRPQSYPNKSASENTKGNMEVADNLVDEIMKTAKKSSVGEDTLYIFTADHGIEHTHVLLSLWDPKNEVGQIVTEPLDLLNLERVVRQVLKTGNYDPSTIGTTLKFKPLNVQ